MKTAVTLLALLLVLVLLLAWQVPARLGFSVTALPDALQVGTGMAAKLGCSGHFITGLDAAQLQADLASYSPVYSRIALQLGEREVSASLFGLARASATWRPGIGCSLDIGDDGLLDRLRPVPVPAAAASWPRGDLVDTIDPDVQAVMDAVLLEDNAAGLETRALVMVRGGGIVAESYADGFGTDTPLLGWSMAKSVTAIMMGRMQALGLLPEDERAFDEGPLFPAWQSGPRREIRLMHLLQMTPGLAWDETYTPGSDSTRMLFQAASASDVALQSALRHPPGEHFYYSSGTTNLLTRFMHDRLGGAQAQLDFFSRELLAPLGMRHTLLEPDPSGVFVGSSFIYGSGRDWARLGLLMLNRGEFGGQRILRPDWVDRAIAPNASRNDSRYGYQFWLNGRGATPRWFGLPWDAYAMMGNRNQIVMIIPSADAVLVRLGWTAGHYPMESNFQRLLDAGS